MIINGHISRHSVVCLVVILGLFCLQVSRFMVMLCLLFLSVNNVCIHALLSVHAPVTCGMAIICFGQWTLPFAWAMHYACWDLPYCNVLQCSANHNSHAWLDLMCVRSLLLHCTWWYVLVMWTKYGSQNCFVLIDISLNAFPNIN